MAKRPEEQRTEDIREQLGLTATPRGGEMEVVEVERGLLVVRPDDKRFRSSAFEHTACRVKGDGRRETRER